jgi:hypothetical protein
MSRTLTILAVLLLLVAVTCAYADVTITAPVAGALVGPSTVVTGAATQRAFLVIYSEVKTGDTVTGNVPGIRHWTNDDNSYNVKISTPRLYLRNTDDTGPLTYVIHVRAYSKPPAKATDTPDLGEATVTVSSAIPAPAAS